MRLLSIVLSVAVAVALAGCGKSTKGCTPTTPAEDDAKMLAYISANGITATKHSSGLYYQVIDPGTGATPTLSSKVTVKYTGKLTDNTVFDSSTPKYPDGVEFYLSDLIAGWQIGIPLVKKGGKVKLVIPPYLGYGCEARGPLPNNAVLFFDIELVDVK
jgi:FKBP-type peptidyl-prolyl cis-trans isomerase FkpA